MKKAFPVINGKYNEEETISGVTSVRQIETIIDIRKYFDMVCVCVFIRV
jgi:hypothetical protein